MNRQMALPESVAYAPGGGESARMTEAIEAGGDGDSFDTFYNATVGLLRFIAHVRFRIPLPDAEAIVQDAFLKYVRDSRDVRDPRRWIITAVLNASRNYVSDHRREVPLPEDIERWEDPAGELRRCAQAFEGHERFADPL